MRFYFCALAMFAGMVVSSEVEGVGNVGGGQGGDDNDSLDGKSLGNLFNGYKQTAAGGQSENNEGTSKAAPVEEKPVAGAKDVTPSQKLSGRVLASPAEALSSTANTFAAFTTRARQVDHALSELGVQAVNMAAQVHVLNTYIDLLQRVAGHLDTIARNEESVNALILKTITRLSMNVLGDKSELQEKNPEST